MKRKKINNIYQYLVWKFLQKPRKGKLAQGGKDSKIFNKGLWGADI